MKEIVFSKTTSVFFLLSAVSSLSSFAGSQKPISRMNFEALDVSRSEDKSCRGVPFTLRQFFYDAIIRAAPRMSESQKLDAVSRYSKLLAMAVKESSGNAANITDMKLRGSSKSDRLFFSQNRSMSMGSALQVTLDVRAELLAMENLTWDKQTNFGVLQMSADRLYSKRNVAIYKKYQNLAARSPRAAVQICGANFLYKDAENILAGELEDAASCQVNYRTIDGVKCFGRLATICPALNLELALSAPDAYFATRKATPQCVNAFKEVLSNARIN